MRNVSRSLENFTERLCIVKLRNYVIFTEHIRDIYRNNFTETNKNYRNVQCTLTPEMFCKNHRQFETVLSAIKCGYSFL